MTDNLKMKLKQPEPLALVSVIALVIIFLLLYGQFHSATQSGIILLNMPLAIIGGVFLLRPTTGELNIPAIDRLYLAAWNHYPQR